MDATQGDKARIWSTEVTTMCATSFLDTRKQCTIAKLRIVPLFFCTTVLALGEALHLRVALRLTCFWTGLDLKRGQTYLPRFVQRGVRLRVSLSNCTGIDSPCGCLAYSCFCGVRPLSEAGNGQGQPLPLAGVRERIRPSLQAGVLESTRTGSRHKSTPHLAILGFRFHAFFARSKPSSRNATFGSALFYTLPRSFHKHA